MAVLEEFGVRSSCTTTSSQSSLFHTATEGMPSSSGKRPSQSRRRGGRRDISAPRDTTGYQPRVAGVDVPHPSESHYTCTWIKETRAFMCYGCDHPLRPKPTGLPSDVVPPAPFDVVLCRKELRMYKTQEKAPWPFQYSHRMFIITWKSLVFLRKTQPSQWNSCLLSSVACSGNTRSSYRRSLVSLKSPW